MNPNGKVLGSAPVDEDPDVLADSVLLADDSKAYSRVEPVELGQELGERRSLCFNFGPVPCVGSQWGRDSDFDQGFPAVSIE